MVAPSYQRRLLLSNRRTGSHAPCLAEERASVTGQGTPEDLQREAEKMAWEAPRDPRRFNGEGEDDGELTGRDRGTLRGLLHRGRGEVGLGGGLHGRSSGAVQCLLARHAGRGAG